MSTFVSNSAEEGMGPVALTVNIELSKDSGNIGSFGSSTYPEFHGLVWRGVNDELFSLFVIGCCGQDTFHIRAMPQFSECEAAQIFALLAPSFPFQMLLTTQIVQCLVVELQTYSEFRWDLLVMHKRDG